MLYEIFTGKRAFAEKAARGAGPADRTPSRPSSVVKDLDPIVEKVILRCLETEPYVAPGHCARGVGGPAGRRSAGSRVGCGRNAIARNWWPHLEKRRACVLRIAVALSCYRCDWARDRRLLSRIHYGALEKMHLDQTPEVLTHRAREIVSRAGYTQKPADSAFSFDYDTDYRDYVERNDRNPWIGIRYIAAPSDDARVLVPAES